MIARLYFNYTNMTTKQRLGTTQYILFLVVIRCNNINPEIIIPKHIRKIKHLFKH